MRAQQPQAPLYLYSHFEIRDVDPNLVGRSSITLTQPSTTIAAEAWQSPLAMIIKHRDGDISPLISIVIGGCPSGRGMKKN